MKINSKLSIILSSCYIGVLSAQPNPLPTVDDNLIIPTVPDINSPHIGTSSQSTLQAAQPTPTVTEEDLKQNVKLTEYVINQAIFNQDWTTLRHIIQFYPQMSGIDPILRDYVQGAIYRQEGKHHLAIKLYRHIITENPDLSYIRLDLAAMMFENKQYKNAQQQFEQVLQDDIVIEAAQQVRQYLRQIKQQNQWQIGMSASVEYNSNINNKTSNKYLDLPMLWNEKIVMVRFPKSPEAYPKSGTVWGLSAYGDQDLNLQDNHFISSNINLNAKFYPNYKELNETYLTLGSGYKYQNLRSWLKVQPYIRISLLDQKLISRDYGLTTEYGNWLNPRWQTINSYTIFSKNYAHDNHEQYNGHVHVLSSTLVKVINPRFFVYTNIGLQREILHSGDESSTRYSGLVGYSYAFNNGLQNQFNIAYSQRKFDDPYFMFMNKIRRDREFQLSSSLWHPKFQWYGITPKLNLQHLKVNSNLYAYKKRKTQLVLSFDKKF